MPSAGVRYGELAMVRGSYSFNLFEQYRFDLFVDRAWGRVRASGVPGVVAGALGAAHRRRRGLQPADPGSTAILRAEVGKSFLPGRYDGLGSTTVQVMLLKPLN